eukprot:gnl/MRDRNA2_/MRDRNA2_105586_c0_seq1.p1 gnl/MRDRNA2_/MRDRNA2_105586_c0~~gnl/MRDRNA2_/MRDRNA2_105586_c0_seq1.p1  ORF type:complete len:900 (-),score=159.00 gnl/MRDRNA2_/MRDRNA2_105586_c0_seq1:146-2845(-)
MAFISGLQFLCPPVSGADSAYAQVPLHEVQVNVLVVDRVATHSVNQTYVNEEAFSIEAKYVFPLPENASVVEFVARFANGRMLRGVVKKRDEARTQYNQAVQRGARAALLEEERPDIFQASIGNISAGEQVVVTIRYCLELPVEQDSVRLTIPSHVGARYSPRNSPETSGAREDIMKNLTYSESGGVLFSAIVSCEMGGIEAITSPTHPSSLSSVELGNEPGKATVRISNGFLDKDIVVCIKPKDLFQPVVTWETWDQHGTEALMLNLVPKFEVPMIDKVEVVFVVDCSASMSGQRIHQAKRAMQIFIRSLPEGCQFNIVKFGSHFASLQSYAVPYSDGSLASATKYIDQIFADMGGTEILSPLKFVHSMPLKHGFSRQVFLLTDGQVSNEQQIIDFVQTTKSRIFTLGIGSGVSTFLVKGLSRATAGYAGFVQDHEKLEPVCISLLKKALTPALSNLKIKWPAQLGNGSPATDLATAAGKALSFFNPSQKNSSESEEARTSCHTVCQQAPQSPPALYPDSNFCAFALYPQGILSSRNPETNQVTITGDAPAGKLTLTLQLPPAPVNRIQPLVHRMAARALIQDLEEKSLACPDEATRLSLRFSVLCQSTAFVAIDETTGVNHAAEVVTRIVPQPSCRSTFLTDQRSALFGSRSFNQERSAFSCSAYPGDIAQLENKVHQLNNLNCHFNRSLDNQCCLLQTMSCRSLKRSLLSWFTARAVAMTSSVCKILGCTSALVSALVKFWQHKGPAASLEHDEESAVQAKLVREDNAEHDSAATTTLGVGTSVCKAEVLEQLLRLSAANGRFALSKELISILRISDATIHSWSKDFGIHQPSTDVLMTSLVLAFLRREFPKETDIWVLVGSKSLAWLQTQEKEWKTEAIQHLEALLFRAAKSLPR